jgi:UDP-N-acetylmuramoylalanine--D-glutamate ligase
MIRDLAGQSIAVAGYGITGRACVRFLLSQKANICVIDSDPAIANKLEQNTNVSALELTAEIDLSGFSTIVISPGVDPHQACFKTYVAQGGELIGDIELFAWFNETPLIGITGSNGKTTVTDMLGKVLSRAGLNVELAGNYGKCALDLLMVDKRSVNSADGRAIDLIVLELSSYQLEMTSSLQLDIGTILNISEDHLDRHGSFEEYKKAKQAIFAMTSKLIVCRDEPESYPSHAQYPAICAEVGRDNCNIGYSIQTDNINANSAEHHIQFNGEAAMSLSDLALKGIHNQINAMTVLAICDQLKLDRKLTIPAICEYKGLPHRFEVIKEYRVAALEKGALEKGALEKAAPEKAACEKNENVQGAESKNISWINDSKATNIGACLAALDCFANTNEYVILIAGGDSKGVNLAPLLKPIKECVKQLIVLGKDANKFIELFPNAHPVNSLQEAVALAIELLKSASFSSATVLLSPACASIDMFKNYQQRGDVFTHAVNQQVAL